jgi:hypothetical protein
MGHLRELLGYRLQECLVNVGQANMFPATNHLFAKASATLARSWKQRLRVQ